MTCPYHLCLHDNIEQVEQPTQEHCWDRGHSRQQGPHHKHFHLYLCCVLIQAWEILKNGINLTINVGPASNKQPSVKVHVRDGLWPIPLRMGIAASSQNLGNGENTIDIMWEGMKQRFPCEYQLFQNKGNPH